MEQRSKGENTNGKVLNPNINFESNLIFDNKIVSEYVPTKLAASILGISENALRIKVCRGEISPLRLGRSLRFRVSEMVGLLHEGRR